MKLSHAGIKDRAAWEGVNIALPEFDVDAMLASTGESPEWVHFGAGNIFRAFVANIAQRLLNRGLVQSGIVAVETFDYEIVEKVYAPYDNLTLLVGLPTDGNMSMEVIGSVAKSICADPSDADEWADLQDIFKNPKLKLASFTITEKGYAVRAADGKYLPLAASDIASGPASPRHTMSIVAALMHSRFLSGAAPIALVSMDNYSRNGEIFYNAVTSIAKGWCENGYVKRGFLEYLSDEKCVSFPWSMIDKITPYPDDAVYEELTRLGIDGMAPVKTVKNVLTAPFVNAEIPEYLVLEDSFPNGRPPLEKANVYMTNRETVSKTEKMKVTTCLNPLHTALAVFGCLLGFTKISDTMKDPDLKALVYRIGYIEGMPVVVDPKIINPGDFIKEVIEERFPNPFLPDTPQRIVTDTSQKTAIRFGETIKAYMHSTELDAANLTAIPLAIAGWIRYLLAVDDSGNEMPLSPDPMLDELRSHLSGIRLGGLCNSVGTDTLGKPHVYGGRLKPILSNTLIFGVDLYDAGLGKRIESIFCELTAGTGAVRRTLRKYLAPIG